MRSIRYSVPVLLLVAIIAIPSVAGASSRHDQMASWGRSFAKSLGPYINHYKAMIVDLSVGNRTGFATQMVNMESDAAKFSNLENSPCATVNRDIRLFVKAIGAYVIAGLHYVSSPSIAAADTFTTLVNRSLAPLKAAEKAEALYLRQH
jgi:hypothetical protein